MPVSLSRVLALAVLTSSTALAWARSEPLPRVTAALPHDGTWTQLPPPIGRYGHAAVCDPLRDRMILIAGRDFTREFNDVWASPLSGDPGWSQLAPTGPPPSRRSGLSAIHDPARDRVIVFGGSGLADVWALGLSGSLGWTELAPSGAPPAGRSGHGAIYDPVRDRMIVFGGSSSSIDLDDVWALDLSGNPSWTPLVPAGTPPAARSEHSAIYDPAGDRMIVFGGKSGGSRTNDVWALELLGSPEWSEILPSGSPPAPRARHAAIHDPGRDRMVVFGGFPTTREVWTLELSGIPQWTQLAPGGTFPAARADHGAIYDPARERMVACGGDPGALPYLADAWALDLAGPPSWSELSGTEARPPGSYGHTAVGDPALDRMVVFGGGVGRNDVWELSFAVAPEWRPLAPAGSPPSGRIDHTAVPDSRRNRMIVFGGFDGSRRNDVWTLDLGASPAWTALAPSGATPPARSDHAAIYDPPGDRMIVFGGITSSGYVADLWELSLAGAPAWNPLSPAGTPPASRGGHSAIHDPVRGRMIVFGGFGVGVFRSDVWELELEGGLRWTELSPAGSSPVGRFAHSAIYDPTRDRMIVFAGRRQLDPITLDDVWELSLSGELAWTQLAPSGVPVLERFKHSAIYDPRRNRMVAFGGENGPGVFDDTWVLAWGLPLDVAGARPPRLDLRARPNPSRGSVEVDFVLAREGWVRLEVHDAQGRRIARLLEGMLPAGRHAATWRGANDAGAAQPAGVYLIRLDSPDGREVRRVALIR